MMIRRRTRGAIALTATALTAGLTLTACGGSGGAQGAESKLNVVASFYPMEFLADPVSYTHL